MGTFENLLGHIIDLEFTTHESMINAALLWDLEEYQLDSGSFKGTMNAVHTLHTQIASTFRSNGVFIKGEIPKNSYLFASVESEGKITHNGLNILEDELIVLNENDQVDFTASSAVNDMTIAIDKDFFDAAFKNYFNESFEYDTLNKRIQLKENTGTVFRYVVKMMVAELMLQGSKLQNDPSFHEKTEEEILQLLFENMDLYKERKKVLESELNGDKIRQYIEKNYKMNICFSELCCSNKLSERTLRLSFKNLFGLSPKQYHISYRLGKIHHAFLRANSNLETVESIAYDYGFTHMGRFSTTYKYMFGNKPSYTLKNSSL